MQDLNVRTSTADIFAICINISEACTARGGIHTEEFSYTATFTLNLITDGTFYRRPIKNNFIWINVLTTIYRRIDTR